MIKAKSNIKTIIRNFFRAYIGHSKCVIFWNPFSISVASGILVFSTSLLFFTFSLVFFPFWLFYIYMRTSWDWIYIYIYIYLCVCVCVSQEDLTPQREWWLVIPIFSAPTLGAHGMPQVSQSFFLYVNLYVASNPPKPPNRKAGNLEMSEETPSSSHPGETLRHLWPPYAAFTVIASDVFNLAPCTCETIYPWQFNWYLAFLISHGEFASLEAKWPNEFLSVLQSTFPLEPGDIWTYNIHGRM